jgi:hypothetical protein
MKIRYQSWCWNEIPRVNSLNEFMKTFNAGKAGLEVVRGDSRYADRQEIGIHTQSPGQGGGRHPPANPALGVQ